MCQMGLGGDALHIFPSQNSCDSVLCWKVTLVLRAPEICMYVCVVHGKDLRAQCRGSFLHAALTIVSGFL